MILLMGNRSLKKRVQSLTMRIEEHRFKIENEKSKQSPDYGLIQHWRVEIAAFQKSIDRATKRLEP